MAQPEEKTKGQLWIDVEPFGWLVRYEHTDTWIDFKAYEVISTATDGSEKSFRRLGAKGSGNETTNPDEAESIDGHVKWDGCMEVGLGRPHFCGAHDVAAFAQVLVKLHELCTLLPKVDRDCAGY